MTAKTNKGNLGARRAREDEQASRVKSLSAVIFPITSPSLRKTAKGIRRCFQKGLLQTIHLPSGTGMGN